MRCFVAVELIAELRQPLVALLAQLPRSREVRWCTPDQLHVTLKFLGEVPEARIPQVCQVLTDVSAGIAPFSIRLSGLGCFPTRQSPRVLWCGVEDAAQGCGRWVAAADPLLAELGFERESRAYTPHITLGRSKSGDGAALLREILDRTVKLPDRPMLVQQVVLFESRLRPQGAQYIPVAGAPLGTAPTGG